MARFSTALRIHTQNMHRYIHAAAILVLLGVAGWLTPVVVAATAEKASDETVEALARVLEDPEALARLLQALRETAPAESTPVANGLEVISLPRQVALLTQRFVESAVDEIRNQIRLVIEVARGSIHIDYASVFLALLDLVILIAATASLFWLLRRMAVPAFRHLDQWVRKSPARSRWLRQIPAVALAFLLDVLMVGLGWIGGHALGLFLLGEPGALETQYSLFLNAFLLVELLKAVVRLFLASRFQGLRILPVDGEDSAFWNAWLSRMIGFLGYGLLVVVPLVKLHISVAAGTVATLLIILTALSKSVGVILQNRAQARRKLEALGEASQLAFFRLTMNFVAHIWHWVALLYLAALAIISITRPENALPFMASATLQTLVAIIVGFVIAGVLTQIISRRIRIPQETREHFPLLEDRLNAYVPTALKVMRAGIILSVIAVIADAWAVFNLAAWVSSESGSFLLSKVLSVTTILVFTALLWLLIASWIEHQLSTSGPAGAMAGARKKTLLAIFRNAVAVTLLIMVTMIVLAEIGINIGPLIAGAGVIGLAIGFGAQKLVQDIITGVFIQLENAMNAGDVVQVAGITGTVEKLTIRSLGLRDISGTQHVIPFSSVTTVSNLTRDFGYHVGIYGVAYRENTDMAIEHLRAAYAELLQDPQHAPNILGDLEVHGITEFGDNAVNLRVRIKTLPGMQWGIGRAYNRLVKLHFDAAGIEIPFPHRTIYFGVDKDGRAPPMQIAQADRNAD